MSNAASHADHGQAIRQFINHVRTTYPNVTLVWKSPTALHIHLRVLPINDGKDKRRKRQFEKDLYAPLRYMSASRSFAWYQFHKHLFEEELLQNNIPLSIGRSYEDGRWMAFYAQ
jgi:hypothetical protein